jgi:RimJ/RimL family protein N-acetyltransferase
VNGDLGVRLRPFEERDLALLERFASDPEFSRPFEWLGFTAPQSHRQRFEEDGFLGKDPRQLVVSLADGTAAGSIQWRDPVLFGPPGWEWNIGVLLAPEHRGQGIGTASHLALADYLFETTPTHRISVYTETGNVAEQRVLEKAGFVREGVLRQLAFRGGVWRDEIVYARLRSDDEPVMGS